MHRCVLILVVQLCHCAAVSAQTPEWNKEKALQRLDDRSRAWLTAGKALATDVKGKVTCISCHTTLGYALARPMLRQADSGLLDQLLSDTERRVTNWPTVQFMYESSQEKKAESRGTEAVLSALMLAWNDAVSKRPLASDRTRLALSRVWEEQRADGGWNWLLFPFEPWETKDAEFMGAAMAAYAVGLAPGYVDAASQGRVDSLRTYLRKSRSKQRILNQAWLLLASTQLPGLLEAPEKEELIKRLLGPQKPNGGWVLADLGPWRQETDALQPRSLDPGAKEPDGYATGFVTFTLLQAGVAKNHPQLQAALAWLNRAQREDGSWPAFSLNRMRGEGDVAYHFMSDAATSWAVIALLTATK